MLLVIKSFFLSFVHISDRHHAKAFSHSPALNHHGGLGALSSLTSNSQNGLAAAGGNRGILLATIPHQINSLESFKGHGFRVSFSQITIVIIVHQSAIDTSSLPLSLSLSLPPSFLPYLLPSLRLLQLLPPTFNKPLTTLSLIELPTLTRQPQAIQLQ